MQINELRKSVSEMDRDEILALITKTRQERRDKASSTTTKRSTATAKRGKKSQLDDLLAQMTAEEIQAIMKELS